MNTAIEENCSWQYYCAYGLVIRSEIDLPELGEINVSQKKNAPRYDVTVRLGPVPKSFETGTWVANYMQHSGARSLIVIAGITRMLVENYNQITMEALEGSPLSDARVFLLGSGLGLVLHQRNILPLHVSALKAPFGAVAITGPSGAGKSTAAINLHLLSSWPIICDDVAVAKCSGEKVVINSGINRVKIWRDAVEALGMDVTTLSRDIVRMEKFHVAEPSLFTEGSAALSTLIILKDGEETSYRELFGMEKFSALLNSIYRPEFARIYWKQPVLAQRCTETAARITVQELTRDKALVSADETARLIHNILVE